MVERHIHNTAKVEDILQLIGSGELVTGTIHATPGTETAYAHTLGRVPRGFIVFSSTTGAILDGSTAHTDALIYLKSPVASSVFTVYVF